MPNFVVLVTGNLQRCLVLRSYWTSFLSWRCQMYDGLRWLIDFDFKDPWLTSSLCTTLLLFTTVEPACKPLLTSWTVGTTIEMGSSQYLSFRILENAYMQGGLLDFNGKLNSTKSHGRSDEELPSDIDTTPSGHQRNNYDLLLWGPRPTNQLRL